MFEMMDKIHDSMEVCATLETENVRPIMPRSYLHSCIQIEIVLHNCHLQA
jgi:hypothetical protein